MEVVNSINIYYANARIALLSNKLFGKDKYNRLCEAAELSDAIKILHEAQFGKSAEAHDIETLFQNELTLSTDLLKELCPNKHAVDFFLCAYDYHNAKVLMKCKYERLDGLNLCFGCGNIAPEPMRELINSDQYGTLPPQMAQALHKIDNEFASGNRSPRVIDITLDKAMFAHMQSSARKSGLTALKSYCSKSIDLINILLLFRYKKNRLDKQGYVNEMLDGGKLKNDFLLSLFDKEASQIIDAFYLHEYLPFAKICTDCLSSGSLSDAQQYINSYKASILSNSQNQDTVLPILAYFTAKTAEIDKIRFILTCIKQGTDKDIIKDRISKLYA